MIDLARKENVFIITMDDGENRWNTNYVREFAAALDEVEISSGAAALVTSSSSEKFFSNGLDLAWWSSEDNQHPGGDRDVFATEFMCLMARLITFPMPTLCAINGHAFGAGFMIALCHDVRTMREDRGYICANEIELGLMIPDPELALFRHKLAINVFFETVQLGRRWSGPDALQAGIVQQLATLDKLGEITHQRAQTLSRLGENREVYSEMKERIYGENAAINNVHGPAYMLRNNDDFTTQGLKILP